MAAHNAINERVKRRYFTYLKEAKRHSEPTVDAVAKALSRYEVETKYRDFGKFHVERVIAFKNRLAEHESRRTGDKLSIATRHATLSHLRNFFRWLAGQPGFKSRLQYSDADYFSLSEKDARVASAQREQRVPTIEQILHVLKAMPRVSPIEQRNRALIAFTLLTGARDSAIASMKLKHVNPAACSVYQDAREVRTKYGKTFTTFFFPVGHEIHDIVLQWLVYLRETELWGNEDPLFPATRVELNSERQFEAVGLARIHWSNAAPIREIFRRAFADGGLRYFNPHSFRNTLVRLGQAVCQTPEQFKAWSQNLGHEGVLTTFYSYGQVASPRQGEILQRLAETPSSMVPNGINKLIKALVREFRVADASD
jgi:site-specific recombinase XerD